MFPEFRTCIYRLLIITIRLRFDSSRYVEFTMLKKFHFLVIMYSYVRRDSSMHLVDVLMSCNSNSIFHWFIDHLHDTNMCRAASFLTELLIIKEGKLQLHNNHSRLLSHNGTDDIISHICLSHNVITCPYNFLSKFGFILCTSCAIDYNKRKNI
jgi:hypothetical protein